MDRVTTVGNLLSLHVGYRPYGILRTCSSTGCVALTIWCFTTCGPQKGHTQFGPPTFSILRTTRPNERPWYKLCPNSLRYCHIFLYSFGLRQLALASGAAGGLIQMLNKHGRFAPLSGVSPDGVLLRPAAHMCTPKVLPKHTKYTYTVIRPPNIVCLATRHAHLRPLHPVPSPVPPAQSW